MAWRDRIHAWVAEVGPAPACSRRASAATEVSLAPDVSWIRDASLLDPALSARLVQVHEHRWTGTREWNGGSPGLDFRTMTDSSGARAPSQRYVAVTTVGNPDFGGDDAYADAPYPTRDLRLLAVFRLWNALEYWFPYRGLIPGDRVAMLRAFVPAVWDATDADDYGRAVMRLVARIHDSHANLWSSLHLGPPAGAPVVLMAALHNVWIALASGLLPLSSPSSTQPCADVNAAPLSPCGAPRPRRAFSPDTPWRFTKGAHRFRGAPPSCSRCGGSHQLSGHPSSLARESCRWVSAMVVALPDR